MWEFALSKINWPAITRAYTALLGQKNKVSLWQKRRDTKKEGSKEGKILGCIQQKFWDQLDQGSNLSSTIYSLYNFRQNKTSHNFSSLIPEIELMILTSRVVLSVRGDNVTGRCHNLGNCCEKSFFEDGHHRKLLFFLTNLVPAKKCQ